MFKVEIHLNRIIFQKIIILVDRAVKVNLSDIKVLLQDTTLLLLEIFFLNFVVQIVIDEIYRLSTKKVEI